MAGELMIINPRKRRARKGRSAAQRAATRRLVAGNRGRASPVRRRRRANPARRYAASNIVRRHHAVHRRRRRNPISAGHSGGIMGLLLNAAKGGAGAVAVEVIAGYLPLPASWQVGTMRTVSRAALAVLLGTFGRKFLGPTAVKMAEGALTVQAANLIASFLPASMLTPNATPGGNLMGFGYGGGGYGYDYGTDTGLGMYVGSGGSLPAPSPRANVGSGMSMSTGEYVY